MAYWREKAQSVIHPALQEGNEQGLKGRALRRHIRNQYPLFDPLEIKKFYPYRVWLEEVDRALSGHGPDSPQIRLNLFS